MPAEEKPNKFSFIPEKNPELQIKYKTKKLKEKEERDKQKDEFRKKKEEALRTGWNNSGPIAESPAMKSITKDLEEKVSLQ